MRNLEFNRREERENEFAIFSRNPRTIFIKDNVKEAVDIVLHSHVEGSHKVHQLRGKRVSFFKDFVGLNGGLRFHLENFRREDGVAENTASARDGLRDRRQIQQNGSQILRGA